MKHSLIFSIALLFVVLPLLTGCSKGPKKPADSPPVSPCKVTVVNGGTPIQGATISFVYDEYPTSATTGSTNEKGIAEMRSIFGSFVGPGAPLGKCKVAVTKEPSVPDAKTQEERDNMSDNEARAYAEQREKAFAALPREIPASLGDSATSKIEFDVQKSGNDFTIDVSQYK